MTTFRKLPVRRFWLWLVTTCLGFTAGCGEVDKLKQESEEWRKQSDEWRDKTTELLAQMTETLVTITPGGMDQFLRRKLADPATTPEERKRLEKMLFAMFNVEPDVPCQISVELHGETVQRRFDFAPAKSPNVEFLRSYLAANHGPRLTEAKDQIYSTRTPIQVRSEVRDRIQEALKAISLKITTEDARPLKDPTFSGIGHLPFPKVAAVTSVELEFGPSVDRLTDAILKAYAPSDIAGTKNASKSSAVCRHSCG